MDALTKLEVQIARIDERTEHMVKSITVLDDKVGKQNTLIQEFQSDKKWIIAIFGMAYGLLVGWIKSKFGST